VADLLGSDPDCGEVSTAARDRRRRRILTAPIVTIALLVPLAGPAHADQNEDLARLRSANVPASMLADSVVDLSGKPAADSVLKLNAADSVTGLKKTEKSAGTAVVTLTSDLLFEFGKAALTPASTAAIPDVAKGIARGAAVAFSRAGGSSAGRSRVGPSPPPGVCYSVWAGTTTFHGRSAWSTPTPAAV
jgi:hypothetical protein